MNVREPLALGDMSVLPGHYPAKLLKALAVIADSLHPTFARQPWIKNPDKSKESCVLASLAVRDFLRAIGFAADVRPVMLIIRAFEGDRELHSAGIGVPDRIFAERYPDLHLEGRWNGHLVAMLPRARIVIDTTLYEIATRKAWADIMPPMLAVQHEKIDKRDQIGRFIVIAGTVARACDGRKLVLTWLDRPDNTSWQRKGHDADRWRRKAVVAALVERFGTWRVSEAAQ